VCLYGEPQQTDPWEPFGVRLRKIHLEIESARKSLRWVFWADERLRLRAYQLEAEAWMLDKRYREAHKSIESGLAIDEASLVLISDKAAMLSELGLKGVAKEVLSAAFQEARKSAGATVAREDLACAAVSLALLRRAPQVNSPSMDSPSVDPPSVDPLFREAVKMYPRSFVAQWGYGQSLIDVNPEKSLKFLEEAYRKDPTDAVNGLQIAEAHFNIANSESQESQSKSLRLAHYRKARLHYEEGFKYASRLSTPMEGEEKLYVDFGITLFQLGEAEAAREMLEKGLLSISPVGPNDDVNEWIGSNFLFLSAVYAYLEEWDSVGDGLRQAVLYDQSWQGTLDRFRRERKSHSKWKQWGCDNSLTLYRSPCVVGGR
jgi:tetratricopeptide (TPR) repeat protein